MWTSGTSSTWHGATASQGQPVAQHGRGTSTERSAGQGPRFAQGLFGLSQLAVLPLKHLDALLLLACRLSALPLVAFGLPHPVAPRLSRAADLLGNQADGLVLRGILALMIDHHPNRSLAGLRQLVWCSLRYGSILTGVGASDNSVLPSCSSNSVLPSCSSRLMVCASLAQHPRPALPGAKLGVHKIVLLAEADPTVGERRIGCAILGSLSYLFMSWT